tara:strand:+ start:1049 stop:1228 length:180 start_codon:yes stop_codon:yes gene_type:complete
MNYLCFTVNTFYEILKRNASKNKILEGILEKRKPPPKWRLTLSSIIAYLLKEILMKEER